MTDPRNATPMPSGPGPFNPRFEPSIASIADRQRIASREAEVARACAKAYPRREQGVQIRIIRGQVGVVMETGFEHAVEAILCGNAELVQPAASTI